MNEQILLTKLGFSTHMADPASLVSDDWERSATCSKCGLDISSYWNDDPDRLTGWTAWKSLSGSCQA